MTDLWHTELYRWTVTAPQHALRKMPPPHHGNPGVTDTSTPTRRWRIPLHVYIAAPLTVLMLATVPSLTIADFLIGQPMANTGLADLFFRRLKIAGLILLLAIPLTWWLAGRLSRSLRVLLSRARAIGEFRFDQLSVTSVILEVDDLARAMTRLRDTIRQFLDISTRLAAERPFKRLLTGVITETAAAVRADVAAVYLLERDGVLRLTARLGSAGVNLESGAFVPVDAICHPLHEAMAHGQSQVLTLSPVDTLIGIEWLPAEFPGQDQHLLLTPLTDHCGRSLGLLCLARGGEHGFSAEEQVFISALSGTVAIAIDHQRLLESEKALFESFVHVIAEAIDARSPYTGAHCQRVPELARMLAEAVAAASGQAPHADGNDRAALHLAAWLHDCGKVAMPDHVVDKATRLEVIYDRIHEIRMRFEVLKRDAEIEHWQALATNGGDQVLAAARLAERLRQLDEDFAFVAHCNTTHAPIVDADIKRLLQIGGQVWHRTLDDRIGISAAEIERKRRVPPRALPAREHLLADRMEHLIDFEPSHPLAIRAPGGRAPPRRKRNIGEIYSLSVRHGTLTSEERYLIEAHATLTMTMLARMPFPPELRDVPEIAASHHEHMDGSGYPRGLRGDAIAMPARILAIADVFEALTARDRPYKRARSVAEALAAMVEMACGGQFDPAVLAIFIEAGVYRRYSEAFLAADQCEGVDAAALLAVLARCGSDQIS